MTKSTQFEGGSYRDPSGYVITHEEQIFRTVNHCAADNYRQLQSSGLLHQLIDSGWLIETEEVSINSVTPIWREEPAYLLKHRKLRLITYPYEWCFEQLKKAALFHLDFQLILLKNGWSLSDATAFNIQFDGEGCKPIFIDLLSLRPYNEGEYWVGQSQFCEQFLNPLLLSSYCGISFNNWYRGSLSGISSEEIYSLLPYTKYLSWTLLTNVILPSIIQRRSIGTTKRSNEKASKLASRPLPKSSLIGILSSLRKFIHSLSPNKKSKSVWADYDQDNTYTDKAHQLKKAFVEEFIKSVYPITVWDIGCNTGYFSECALSNGVNYVVGVDYDINCVQSAYLRARDKKLNFIPFYADLSNPSGDAGWNLRERYSLQKRVDADAIIALAFVHHMIIGKNIPMDQVVSWLLNIADAGVVEFVGKNDQTVMEMLALREDIFPDYDLDSFLQELAKHAQIVKTRMLPDSDRVLVWYEKVQ